MYRMSLGISSSIARRMVSSRCEPTSASGLWVILVCRVGRRERGRPDGSPPPAGGGPCSEALESALARIGDLEEGVELGQLEQGFQVVVEVREPQLTALLANLLGQRDQDAEPRAVDVPGLAEVDEKALLSLLQLIEDLLLELLAIADDELPFHINHDDLSLLLDREAHDSFSRGGIRLW